MTLEGHVKLYVKETKPMDRFRLEIDKAHMDLGESKRFLSERPVDRLVLA